ncbi:diaminopimelate decarboxylase [Tunicatimonas pelagia]|uniref:diaminopimelate decarboxylase n=1 Tax=Tunicatimonas pelagia TaxID=931531 RepID=UPI002664ED3F|nr:diaminopimelate decarboxylase [Tunicatimonas pelagia]WKN46090.1 diaminopimelate decarboxylase [Tunicatimonas pelagia]
MSFSSSTTEAIPTTFSPQGVDLTQVCQQFGTPLYLYDADVIIRQINTLKNAFTYSKVKFKYAAKALTNISVLKLIRQQGIDLDVVSIQEAHIGLKAGFSAQQIMYTPSGVPFSEIDEAIALGVQMNVDSLPLLRYIGERYGNTVSCCLRLNPDIRAGGHAKISVGHNESKFGIALSQLDLVVDVVKQYGITINGLHIHTGSDIKDPEVFAQGAQRLYAAAQHFPDLQFIDFGSGFKVAYKEGDVATDIPQLARLMEDSFQEFCQQYGRELEMWFEPGKLIVSDSGYLLAEVTVVKENPGINFVHLDTGLNHLIRPMMYEAYHEIVNVTNPDGDLQPYHVVGYICETDTIAENRMLPQVRQGDIVAIKNAGAYGFSMASNYNARLRPAEVLIHQGEAKLIRQRETMDDILQNQIEISL